MAVNVADLIVSLGGNIAGFNQAMNRVEARLQKTGATFKRVGTDLTIGLSAPLGAIGLAVGKLAIDFESSFAGVRKTVNATDEEFDALAQGMRDLSKVKPIDVNELNRIGEAAGQLGIEKANILDFTTVMADLGNTTNLSAEQAATSLARLSNIMQIPQDQFDEMGSTIVELGNNLATTESEIVEFGLRIGGAGKAVGLSVDEVLAFSGALASVGIRAEAGGTAISRVMIDIAKRVSQGGEALEEIAAVTDQTAEKFKTNFKENASESVLTFIESLGRIQKAGGDVFPILEKLGLDNIRVQDALLRTAGAGKLVRESLDLASEAFIKNSALTDEANERYKTVASQLTIFWNRIKDVGITIGNSLLPAIEDLLNNMKPMMTVVENLSKRFKDWFDSLETGTRQGILVALAGLVALGPVLLGVGAAFHIAAPAVALMGSVFGFLGSVALKLAGPLIATSKYFIEISKWAKFANTSLLAMAGTTFLTIGSFVALGAGVISLVAVIIANWENLKTKSTEIWEKLVDIIHEQIVDRFNRIVEGMKKILQPIVGFFKRVAGAIGIAVPDIIAKIGAGLDGMQNVVVDKVGGMASRVGDALVDTGEDVLTGLDIMKGTFLDTFDGVVAPLKARFGNMVDGLTAEIPKVNFAFEKSADESKKHLEEIADFVPPITEEIKLASAKLEAEMTSNLISEKDARLNAINIELQERIAKIKEFKLASDEQERLITLAHQSAIQQRKEAMGGFNQFMQGQFRDLAESNVFTLSTITSSFAQATAQWIQGVNNFAEFWKQTLNTMLVAVINFVIQWMAQLALVALRNSIIAKQTTETHTAAEEAKTAVTTANEVARTGMVMATNKVIQGGVIATLQSFAAVGNAAMATMQSVVTATASILAAIGAALAASVVGSPMAPAYFAASGLVTALGTSAVITGTGAINAAIGGAIATATTALATPFKEGGLVTGPTFAMIGEAGPEMVIPLSKLSSMGPEVSIAPAPVFLNSRKIADIIFEQEMPRKMRGQGLAR